MTILEPGLPPLATMRMDHMLEEALGRWVWVAVTVDGCEAPSPKAGSVVAVIASDRVSY
jgi:hypothetical protein